MGCLSIMASWAFFTIFCNGLLVRWVCDIWVDNHSRTLGQKYVFVCLFVALRGPPLDENLLLSNIATANKKVEHLTEVGHNLLRGEMFEWSCLLTPDLYSFSSDRGTVSGAVLGIGLSVANLFICCILQKKKTKNIHYHYVFFQSVTQAYSEKESEKNPSAPINQELNLRPSDD